MVDFECKKCAESVESVELNLDEKSQFKLSSGDALERVDKFCYLGDMIGRGGGVEEAVRNRVRCAWCKFRELYPLLAMRGFPLKLKVKSTKHVCRVCCCMAARHEL